MKIGLINFSGNVGKTTLARHLFSPRLDCGICSVETINTDGDESLKLKGKDFAKLQEEMMVKENLVIDIGASNVEDFLGMMRELDMEDVYIDLFVVPVVPATKQQVDSIATIGHLLDCGVEAGKIRVVLNQVELNDDYETTFNIVRSYCADVGVRCSGEVVMVSTLYDMLKEGKQSIADLLSDETDYKALIAKSDDEKEKRGLARIVARKSLAKGVKRRLDDVYSSVVA